MTADGPLLGQKRILELLTELGRRFAHVGFSVDMFVVVGGAIALAYGEDRATRDIDAVFEPKMRVYEIASTTLTSVSLPWRQRHGRAASKWARDHKTQVFGAVQRKRVQMLAEDDAPVVVETSKVTAHVIPSRKKATVMAHVEQRVADDAVIYADDAQIYGLLPQRHETVNHSHGEYVRGDVSTQTIDGFWSLVKRGIDGTHHAVSPKWLQGYVNEYVWWYNRRSDDKSMFAQLLLRSAFPISR